MSIVDALKKLVVAFGGAETPEAVPGSNVAEVINVLAATVQSLTFTDNELPAVESADEGKVLTVDVEGKWVAATLPASNALE